MKAIIPMAGLGTRMLPFTTYVPKEMLPLGFKPVVEHVIEELRTVGIEHPILVVSPDKLRVVQKHFKDQCDYVIQKHPTGLADAVLAAERKVGDDRFVVALGDTVILPRATSPLSYLITWYTTGVIVEWLPPEALGSQGVVAPLGMVTGPCETKNNDHVPVFQATCIVEKPAYPPSNYAVAGRYTFKPNIFEAIRNTKPGLNNEVQLADAINYLLYKQEQVWCVSLHTGDRRFDIGTMEGYHRAFDAAMRTQV